MMHGQKNITLVIFLLLLWIYTRHIYQSFKKPLKRLSHRRQYSTRLLPVAPVSLAKGQFCPNWHDCFINYI